VTKHMLLVCAVLAVAGCTSPRGSIKCEPPVDKKVTCVIDLEKAKEVGAEIKEKVF
jgi:hypothetical protein